MEFRRYLTCLWPGLSELWWRGRLSALPLAVGFAIGLNSLLVLKHFYPDWLSPLLVRSAWWVGVIGWGYWTIRSVRELPELIEPRAVCEQPDRFPDAHAAFLRADWETAERLLLHTLSIEPRDPPALLMLSSLYRHTSRVENAASLIEELRRLEVADGWQIEIEAEVARIERQRDADQAESDAEDESVSAEGEADGGEGPDASAADLTAA